MSGARGALLRGLRAALLGAIHAVLRRPRLRRLALSALARLPGMETRLHRLLHPSTGPQGPRWRHRPLSADDLSPRAARIGEALRRALDDRAP